MMDFAIFTGKAKKTRSMIACTECGREFQRNRKADLQRHMRIHTNEKPFVCPYPDCRKAFRQSSALKNHSNYHQRDLSLTCTHCNMNFFDKPTFNRHNREKHELEYVYACSVPGCGKQFKRKPVFKQHMQDKHAVAYDDNEVVSHRVSAATYLKATSGSKAAFHSGSTPLPKLTEALESVRLAPGESTFYPSNPAMYGMSNAAPVLLSDPYANAKAPPPSYAASISHYAQPPSEYAASYNVMPQDIWNPNGMHYFDGQILNAPCVPMGVPTISFSPASSPAHETPNPALVYCSSGNNSNESAGSFSPHSRSASVSPISSNNSPSSPYARRPQTYY